ncbi:MAG: AAA family ATPase [Candidatus Wildermuthbacteria bacterium RIFCSPHIGHO2_12_FULL_45_9]|nr:MAG: AAA family ATPase [Candidatus Wildermuthbacteria bacterium RIFCSPHIGHO2_12_FULL_45_9]
MLNQQTLSALRELKLYGMSEALECQEQQPDSHGLAFTDRLSLLIDHEITYRKNKRLQRLLKAAQLRHQACIEDIDYQTQRELKKDVMLSLTQCDWIQKKHNLIIGGPTGIGKSWLACALGHQACRYGLMVRYVRLPRLLEELRIVHADGSYPKLMNQLLKTQLLILDDWGLDVLARCQRNDLLEVLEDRHQTGSTLITSQLPVEKWHDFIGDATIADAILDRVVHNAYKIQLNGESMRKKQGEDKKFDLS